ncbi:MAG: cytochrome c4 [Betaproteobacteria bacterium]|nr:cytochrome c4 [Betaproteobacteria bacterium]
MRFRLALVVAICAAIAPLAVAQPAAKADPAQAQPIVIKVCAACHASDGNSASPANPVLAGQHADYTAKQLANYKSGERKNPVMLGMTAALTPQDMKNLGAYFESQKPKTRAAKDVELVKLGRQIYRGGIMDKGVAACASCHGPSGAGIPAQFPRVAGQFAEYTLAQLQAFRLGERVNDPNQMMRVISARLSDREIKAVSEYIAGLR